MAPSQGMEGGAESITRSFVRAIQGVEGRATDLQFRLRGARNPHPDVVVAVVDEAGVQRFGRWPWPRARVAQALRGLAEGGARAVGLDMVFTDEAPDFQAQAYDDALTLLDQSLERTVWGWSLGMPELQRYRQELEARRARSPDHTLAAAFESAPQIIQGVVAYPERERRDFAAREDEYVALLAPHVLTELPGVAPGSRYEVPWDHVGSAAYRSAQAPLPVLARASPRWAHFNVRPDPDGVLRRVPLFVKLARPEGLLPSLALQTAAVGLGARIAPVWDPELERLVGARLEPGPGSKRLSSYVPLELTEPFTLVDFEGSARVFHTVSLADVIEGRAPKDAVRGKVVLMGVALLGAYDQVVTPFSSQEPGIYTHASLLSNILRDRFLVRPPLLRGVEVAFLLVAGVFLAVLLPRVRFRTKSALVAGTVLGWLVVDQILFARGVLLATVLPVTGVLASAGAVLFLGYLSVDREKGQLRVAFSHYLSPAVMDQMLAHPERLKLGGEKREMTVLFSDIRGFTAMSENMQPEALVRFVNSYLSPMTRIVLEQGGTLDKYIGDAVMAFWNAPVSQSDHALRACRAALRFLAELETLKQGWRAEGLPELEIGVGINTGPMVVGNMGSDLRFDYTVMGDAVNLASRLEGANKDYGTRILLSESTHALVSGEVVARRLGAVRLKGKSQPVRIFELRGLGPPTPEEQAKLSEFEAGLALYESERRAEALVAFERLQESWPEDGPTRRYLEELRSLSGAEGNPRMGTDGR